MKLTDKMIITDDKVTKGGALTAYVIDGLGSGKTARISHDGKGIIVPKSATVNTVMLEANNLVVDAGRNLVARHMGQQLVTCDPIKYFSCGDGAFLPGAQVVSQDPPPPLGVATSLKNEVFRKEITPAMISFPNSVSVQLQVLLEDSEANGFTLDEVGLHSDGNILFSTKVFQAIPKLDTRAILFIWTILF